MNDKFIGKAKKLLAGFVAAATAITMMPQIPVFAATGNTTYSYDGYDVEYSVYNEWDNGQTVQIKATNTGEDSILNWAFKYDAEGEITNLWNAAVYDQQGEDYIIKNSGWNYEIAPGQSVNFGYTLVNDEFTTPDSFTLCSKRVEKTSGYEVDFNVVDQWNTGIKAELAITNTSDQPLEAWTVSFDSNFTINNLWDGRLLESADNHYTVASEMWTNPIAPGDSKKIGFTALINSDITPEISNCVLTEVEIDDSNENPDINWDDEPDTDGDGLPDSIEEYLGSDSNNIDTDDDGLSDYYEAIYTYTNPTKVDTDDSGVDDGDKDLDEDGLTNLEELENNTHPCLDDTDADGLSDGDEVKTHGTDPLVADTDGDGLDDGDEIVIGTNPLVKDTDGDGVIDSKEKLEQTFTHKVKNEDCAVTEVIVDMDCTGNINSTTSVESVMNVDILCTEVVGLVGEPFEIETESEFDRATLTFKIDKNKLGEIPFDNLLFLWYNEEEDEFVELETTLDEDNSTASIETTHFSKYMVVDGYQWYKAWSEEFDYNPTGGGSGAPSIPVKYNTVLAIDCSGSMDWNDRISIKSGINSAYDAQHPYTCNRITAAEGFIRYMDSKDDTAIVFFTGSASVAASMTNDTESLKLALQKMYSNGGTSFSAALNAAIAQIDSVEKISNGVDKNRILLLSDGDDGDSASRRNSAIQACKDRYIEVYTVGFGSANENILQQISDETGGKYYKALSADEIVEIFSKFGYENDFDMTDTDGDGLPDAVETVGIRVQNGKILYTDPTKPDTDEDGLPDGKEINPIPQKGIFSGSINNGPFQNSSQYYFKMESYPTNRDSDGDGLLDWVIGSGDKDHIKDPYRLSYNNFFNFGSEEYMRDLTQRFQKIDINEYNFCDISYIPSELLNHKFDLQYEVFVDLMIHDVNISELHELVPDQNWDYFCGFFNKCINNCKGINRERHYFRNKLNRVPNSLSELIAQKDNWLLCAFAESKFHLLGNDGGYNLKFISKCGKYEAVYDKFGNLITEKNGAKNMGTYNYANFKKNVTEHAILDVIPYMLYGNTKTTRGQIIPNTSAYDNNRLAQNYHDEMESLFNTPHSVSDLQKAYKQIRERYVVE